MNLKEAFRLSNKYQELMSEAEQILENEEYTTQVKNTYLRHKVMNEAEDETILEQPEMVYYDKITEVATFLVYLLEERGKLAAARTKNNAPAAAAVMHRARSILFILLISLSCIQIKAAP